MTDESYIVVLGRDPAGGRIARRFRLRVPLACAVGRYERLSDRALNDLMKDLWHEQRRRDGHALDQPSQRWDPYATQIYQETND